MVLLRDENQIIIDLKGDRNVREIAYGEIMFRPFLIYNQALCSELLPVIIVASRPRFGCLEGPTEVYWSLLMPTVISVSIWLPVSSVLSACYYLDRHCVEQRAVLPQLILCIPVCCAR